MRDSLTVLAILLIAVLTTALVGPYLVDWNAHRAEIEARLSALAGASVTVRGPIDLKLLPKPVIRLGSVVVGAAAGPYGAIPGSVAAGPSLTADEVDAELSLPALLRGQVQVVDATLRAPHLDLAQGPDGAIVLPRLSPGEADRVALDHVGIRNGSAMLRLADGRRFALEGIDLDGEATTLRGPFKATGRIGGLPLRFATGALDGGRMRAKLGVEPAEGRPALDLDGTLTLAGGPLAFGGSLSAVGAVPLRDTPATVPWRATAQAKADASGASLTEVELRAGDDLRALIADGSGMLERGAAPDAVPDVALKLHGAGLDLDGLAVAPKDAGIAPPQGIALLRLLVAAVADRGQKQDWPVRLAVDAQVDTATIAGRTLLGATLRLGFASDGGTTVALSTAGPDGARLALDGRLEPGPAFRGRADVATADLARFAAWSKPISPDLASWLATAVPAHAVAVSGDLEVSAGRVAMRAGTLRLDGSRFAGSLAYDGASGRNPPRLTADLTTDRLDLDALPDLGGSAAPGADLDLALATPVVRLAVAGAGAAGVPLVGGPLSIHLRRSGDDLDLDRFSLTLGGATIAATASRTGPQARAQARIDAPALGPIAVILARLVPGPATAALAARAAILSPVSGTVQAEGTAGPDGTLLPTRLVLDGTAGGTRLAATLLPDGGGADAASRPVALSLDASAPDAAVPLRALGLAAVEQAIGPADAHVTARGSLAAGFAVEATATLGSTALTYAGRADGGRGQGRLTLATPDLRPLLAGFGILPAAKDHVAMPADAAGALDWSGARAGFGGILAHAAGATVRGDLAFGQPQPGAAAPGLTGRLALDRLPAAALLSLDLGASTASGAAASLPDAVWSAAPFGPAPVLPPGEVKLTIEHLPLVAGLEAHGAALTLRVTRTGVSLVDILAKLGGGSIDGSVDLARDGASATASGRLAWHDVALDLGSLSAQAGGELRLAGAGSSAAALVHALGGTGRLALASATLARTDPDAPARTAAAFTPKNPLADPDPSGLDAAAIGKRLSDELDKAPLVFGHQTAALLVTGGALRVAALKASGNGASSATEAELDLGDLGLSLRTHLVPVQPEGSAVADGPPGSDAVTVTQAGPIGAPLARRIDAAGLVVQLEAQAAARAQERIDVFDQDIRERAYFNRVLKAIQADQAVARQRAAAEAAAAKAAADVRQAEAVRAKSDEARLQAEIEAAARADAAKATAARSAAQAEAAKAEAETRRFIDRQTQGIEGTGTEPVTAPAPAGRRRHLRPHEAPDLIAPPSIIDDRPHASRQP